MMIIRKKMLKIQERLKMRIGVAYGTYKKNVCTSYSDVIETIEELYRVGFKAFMIPHNVFTNISSITELYKEHYTDILRMKNLASKYNIELSMHVSRFPEEPYLTERLRIYFNISNVCDMRILCLHPIFYPMMPKDQALKLVSYKINEIVNEIAFKSKIGIENTGRIYELGSLEDIVEIHRRTHHTEPVINFAHLHARSCGGMQTVNDFKKAIEFVSKQSRHNFVRNAFTIFSGITYNPSGEIEHVSLRESDMNLETFIKVVMGMNIKGTLIFQLPEREKELVDMIDDLSFIVR